MGITVLEQVYLYMYVKHEAQEEWFTNVIFRAHLHISIGELVIYVRERW